jgi:hypothetical protein
LLFSFILNRSAVAAMHAAQTDLNQRNQCEPSTPLTFKILIPITNRSIRLFEQLLCEHPSFAMRHAIAHDFVRRVLLAPVDAARREAANNKPAARRVIAVCAQLLVRLVRKLLLARAQLHADRPPEDAAALLASQCVAFVALGDLARYLADVAASSSAGKLHLRHAARLYALALRLAPAHGHAHNQLGLVANVLRRRDVALYRYARALLAAEPFLGARDNLLAVADRIRATLADSDSVDDAARKRVRSIQSLKSSPTKSAATTTAATTTSTAARVLSVSDKFSLLYARCVGILVSGTDVEKLEDLLKRTLQHLQTLLRDDRRSRWSVRSAVSSLWLALAAARLASRTDSAPRRAALHCGARRLLLGLLACAVEHLARSDDVSKTSDDAKQCRETSLDACAAVVALFLDWQRAINTEASAVELPDDATPPAVTATAKTDNAPGAIDYRWRRILLCEPLGDLACVALWRACWNSLPKALSAASQRLQRRRGLWPSSVRALPDDIEVQGDDLLRAQQSALRFPLADPHAEWHWTRASWWRRAPPASIAQAYGCVAQRFRRRRHSFSALRPIVSLASRAKRARQRSPPTATRRNKAAMMTMMMTTTTMMK